MSIANILACVAIETEEIILLSLPQTMKAAADFIAERERVCSDKYSVNGKEFIHNKQLRRRCGNEEWRQ